MRQDGDYSTPAADPHVDLPAKIGGRVGQPGHSVSFLATGTGGKAAARLEAAIQALGGRRRPRPATPYLPLGQRDRRDAVLRFCGRG